MPGVASRIRLLAEVFALSLPLCADAQGADASILQRFALPGRGALELRVPQNWVATVRRPTDARPPTITFSPRDGVPFEVSVTPSRNEIFDDSSAGENAMRKRVERGLDAIRSNIVEKDVPIVKFKGASGSGFHFSATDRAPKPMDYKFVTQGVLKVRDIALEFTILTYDGQQDVVQSALSMLRTAQHVPSSPDAAEIRTR